MDENILWCPVYSLLSVTRWVDITGLKIGDAVGAW